MRILQTSKTIISKTKRILRKKTMQAAVYEQILDGLWIRLGIKGVLWYETKEILTKSPKKYPRAVPENKMRGGVSM